MNDNLTELTKAPDSGIAHMIRGQLEAEAIPVFLFDEGMQSVLWHGTSIEGGIRLMVMPDHLDRAREILNDLQQAGV